MSDMTKGGLLQFSGVKEGFKSNLRKTPTGVFLEIFSSKINTNKYSRGNFESEIKFGIKKCQIQKNES